MLLDERVEQVLIRKKGCLLFCCCFSQTTIKTMTPATLSFRQFTWIQGRHCQWQISVWGKKFICLQTPYPQPAQTESEQYNHSICFFTSLLNEAQTKKNSRLGSVCVCVLGCECQDPHILPRQPKINGVRTPGDALRFRDWEQRTQKLQVLMLGQPTACQVTLYNPSAN